MGVGQELRSQLQDDLLTEGIMRKKKTTRHRESGQAGSRGERVEKKKKGLVRRSPPQDTLPRQISRVKLGSQRPTQHPGVGANWKYEYLRDGVNTKHQQRPCVCV